MCSVYGKMRHIYQNFGLHELEIQSPVYSVYAKIEERSVIETQEYLGKVLDLYVQL